MNMPVSLSITLARAHRKSQTDDLETSLSAAAHIARKEIIAEIYRRRSGSPALSLSPVDLVSCLYGAELNLWPLSTQDPERDRLIVSLSDAVPAVRAVARHYGFSDQTQSGELSLGNVGATAAPSGYGLPLAAGMALGLKLQKNPARIYALMGEQELVSGALWQAALIGADHKLDNLCAIVEIFAKPRVIRAPVAARWRAFDWAVAEVDGNNVAQILSAFRRIGSVHDRPTVVLATTARARGIPAWENSAAAAGRRGLTLVQAEEAMAALGASAKEAREALDA
ncbi:MAG: hypothetical protein JOZ55_00120 [Alphaproteobacteria bacterium]|nr:hypothetical protein [Alphaproteobacteria bacterium]